MFSNQYDFKLKVGHLLQTLNIPCENPEEHKEFGYDSVDGECWFCHHEWYKTLPWYLPYHKQSMNEDEALFELLMCGEEDRKSLRRKKRFSCAIRDCFDGEQGEQWDGVASEMFGVELGEFKDEIIEEYPRRRIVRRDKPNLLIVHLRNRYWFESQMADCPAYIEFQFRGIGETHAAIRWRDRHVEISPDNENRIWRLYNFLVMKEPSTNSELQTKTTREHGRPRKFKNRSDYMKALNNAVDMIRAARWALNQTKIAEVLGVSDSRQIRKWCDDFDINWVEWKNDQLKKADKTGE
jgi:hypothetical protein